MIALHISILNGAPYIWSEASHVGALKDLQTALKAIGFDIKVRRSNVEFLTVWLPATENKPLPSSPLIALKPDKKKKVSLRAFSVLARPLNTEEALEFASIARGGNIAESAVIFGNSIIWTCKLLKIALDLALQENFLPTIIRHGDFYEARWQPIPCDESDRQLEKLSAGMPAVCRCLSNDSQKAPEVPAQTVLNKLLVKSLDGIIRGAGLLADSNNRKKHSSSMHDSLKNSPHDSLRSDTRNGTHSDMRNDTHSSMHDSLKNSSHISLKNSQHDSLRSDTHVDMNSLHSDTHSDMRSGTHSDMHDSLQNSPHDSLHDAWIFALTSENAQIMWADKQEILSFSKQLADWSRPVDLIASSPYKFCFRLSEPAGDEEKWRLDYLLQPKDDPSLQLPLAELWHKSSRTVKQLQRAEGSLMEFMLMALGQASGLCPYIAESLKEKDPGGFDLDSCGALNFLKEYSEALRASDFTVLLPSWWVGQATVKHLGLKVKAKSPQMQGSGGILTLNSMVEFNYAASLGNDEISLEELKFLAKLKAPLVKLRGQWTQISQQQINSAILLLEKQKNQKVSARELLTLALGAGRQVAGMSVDTVQADGWLNDLLDKLTRRAEFGTLPQPHGFKGELRPYQKQGFSWLAFLRQWGLGACLADDMGLGKTVQTLALLQRERAAGETRPVLVVCPTTVINNWRKEAEFFTPDLKVLVHHGSDRQKKGAFKKAAQSSAIVISSYGLLQRDIDFLKEVGWAGMILDEAQNIKNPETAQSKAARLLPADYRIALTGTPVENHIGDLWSVMEFLNQGLLGSQNSFKNNFYKPIQIYHKPDAINRLKALTSPFILRRLKTDKSIISDLPEKMEIKDYCTLTKEQASLYKAVVDEMLEQVQSAQGISRRGLVLATLMKLKQVCNHPAQFAKDNSPIADRSGKLQRLKDMLIQTRELQGRTLIFTQFAEMGIILQKYLQELFAEEVFLLHGGTSKKKRDEMVEHFQNDENAPHIFILSLKAGGTGLTLTRANYVIHYDRWWNPAVENQATDRAYRIGQTKNVGVYKFIVAGTLEERIDEMIEKKAGIAADVIGSGEQFLSELSNEDFSKLIRLGSEALGE